MLNSVRVHRLQQLQSWKVGDLGCVVMPRCHDQRIKCPVLYASSKRLRIRFNTRRLDLPLLLFLVKDGFVHPCAITCHSIYTVIFRNSLDIFVHQVLTDEVRRALRPSRQARLHQPCLDIVPQPIIARSRRSQVNLISWIQPFRSHHIITKFGVDVRIRWIRRHPVVQMPYSTSHTASFEDNDVDPEFQQMGGGTHAADPGADDRNTACWKGHLDFEIPPQVPLTWSGKNYESSQSPTLNLQRLRWRVTLHGMNCSREIKHAITTRHLQLHP